MKNLSLGIALLAIAFAAPVTLSAAEGGNNGKDVSTTPTKTAMAACFNTTCPVDGKPVDASVPAISYTPADKAKNAATPVDSKVVNAVGFCCLACHDEFEAHPAQYADKLTPQWQLAKQNQAK
jgi:hypothetical protein